MPGNMYVYLVFFGVELWEFCPDLPRIVVGNAQLPAAWHYGKAVRYHSVTFVKALMEDYTRLYLY